MMEKEEKARLVEISKINVGKVEMLFFPKSRGGYRWNKEWDG